MDLTRTGDMESDNGATPVKSSAPVNRRVLAVDDEPGVANAVARILERENFEVTPVASAEAALESVAQRDFAMILSDNLMPGMKGLELLPLVMRLRPRCRRILITGYTELNDAIEAFNRGILHRYMAKPWQRGALIDMVNEEWSAYFRELEASRELNAREQSLTERTHLVEDALALLKRAGLGAAPVQQQAPLERKLAVVLHGDVVGFSRLMGADHEGTMRSLTQCRELVQTRVHQFRGRLVNAVGDALLAEFPSAVDAVQCAMEVQGDIGNSTQEGPGDRRMSLRLGINIGDVLVKDRELYGEGVNVAARLQALAAPGGVCISESVQRYVKGRLPYTFEYLGEQALKNISDPVGAYAVHLPD